MATILLRRHIGAASAPPAGSANTAGEPRFSTGGFTGMTWDPALACELIIDDGGTNRDLISARRQVQLQGAQIITNGAKQLGLGGAITFATGAAGQINFTSTGNMTFADGNPNQVLTKGAGTAVAWTDPAPFTGVVTDATLRGTGVDALNALGIDPNVWGVGLDIAGDVAFVVAATPAQVEAGTINTAFVHPQNLVQGAFGLPVTSLNTNAQTIVPAINEIFGLVAGTAKGLIFTGSYDVTNNNVTPVGPGAAGPLPAPVAANDGWFVICTTAGTGTGNAPPVALVPGDWIICGENPSALGTYVWHPVPLGAQAILASNVGVVPAVSGQNNVQAALEYLDATKIEAVAVDGTSIVGDGVTVPLSVDIVDGGIF